METQELENTVGPSGDEYALGIRFTPASAEDLVQEFRDMKSAVIDWTSHRGDSGVLVLFTIVADTEIHELFDDLLSKIYVRESELAPILQSRMLQVNLLDRDGNECGQYEVMPSGQAPEP